MQTPIPSDISGAHPERPRGFSDSYQPQNHLRDEMVGAKGEIRPHWKMCASMIDQMEGAGLERRWEHARRTIHENGVTHNVYGEPNGLDRSWDLDLIPLLITPEEWRVVSEGLIQRARLLDLLLADLYGPMETILSGLLPADLIWGNAGFLRACHGVRPPGNRWLQLYAADLVRTPEGQFEVLSDRTQAPSGTGYALENRIAVSRSMPEIFSQCNVHRLAPYFVSLRESLRSLAPAGRESPRIVLLTPGPYNETYFEHSYLSQYLGYSLVQGNDLTVRDDTVYLKTVGGLQRVDVILRRVDDNFCDPLELYAGSYLGVPGLLQAIRRGNVAVANALGTGVLQAPGFLPFLPELCRQLLGEELKLPSTATWWCGQRAEMQYVLDHLHEMVIKPAYPTLGTDPVFGTELTGEDRAQLAEAIKAHPDRYVAQNHSVICTAPAFIEHQLQPRRFVLRSYLVAQGDSYAVMDGAFTRITPSADSAVVSLQRGGGSKDAWVLSDVPVNPVSLLSNRAQPIPFSRGAGDLPSRIADDLFWLARYVERAEGQVRLARAALRQFMEASGVEETRAAQVLAAASQGGDKFLDGPQFVQEVIHYIRDSEGGFGLLDTLLQIQSLTRVLRDRLPADAWRILEEGFQNLLHDQDNLDDPAAHAMKLLEGMVTSLAAFRGLAADSMMRSQAWRFFDMGRRLERAAFTVDLISKTVIDDAANRALLEADLEITESIFPYRRKYLMQLETLAVIDLLLVEKNNPRSAAFQLSTLSDHFKKLPRSIDRNGTEENQDQESLAKLRALIQAVDLPALCEPAGGRPPALALFLSGVLQQISKLADAIAQVYFSHATVSQARSAHCEEIDL